MSSKALREFSKPAPRTVEGFAQAAMAGQVPLVPAQPPTHAPAELIPTSSRMFGVMVIRLIGSGVLYALLLVVVDRYVDFPYHLADLTVLVGGLLWFKIAYGVLTKPMYRILEETRRGYATSTMRSGTIGVTSNSGFAGWEAGAPWSFKGVWVLDSKFQIRSVPDLAIDPPGFYPSPHEPGKWELWTGVVWSGTYRSEPYG